MIFKLVRNLLEPFFKVIKCLKFFTVTNFKGVNSNSGGLKGLNVIKVLVMKHPSVPSHRVSVYLSGSPKTWTEEDKRTGHASQAGGRGCGQEAGQGSCKEAEDEGQDVILTNLVKTTSVIN